MKGFFDTSVLVPVFYGDHVHHKASLRLFIQFDKSTGCCGAHSLAEVYSTLTRMPGKHRISGEQALLFVGSIRERLSIVGMTGNEYADALTACGVPFERLDADHMKSSLCFEPSATHTGIVNVEASYVNQWIAAAVAQKVGAVETAAEFFRQRGEEAKPGDLRAILARVPDRAPDLGDELPEGWQP